MGTLIFKDFSIFKNIFNFYIFYLFIYYYYFSFCVLALHVRSQFCNTSNLHNPALYLNVFLNLKAYFINHTHTHTHIYILYFLNSAPKIMGGGAKITDKNNVYC